ncbi:hypothetical protein SELMODRAFT_445672 [Selaginella moellendorffii]|uniref:Uncharacterized protein n=1 Tax=Selaginella moellendorffii TaxID=88036 RepID=D8SKB5_SELML|nr:hypothetical protein SELMODRAFT_445672 [Selaginella moellendorffii]
MAKHHHEEKGHGHHHQQPVYGYPQQGYYPPPQNYKQKKRSGGFLRGCIVPPQSRRTASSPLHITDRAPTINIQGYGDRRGINITHPSYFSVVMFTWLDMIGFQFYESYITYWVASIPAGSFGPGKGNVVLPYMSPLATNKFLQFSEQNNSYSFALVPQGKITHTRDTNMLSPLDRQVS